MGKSQNIVFGVNPILEKLKASADDISELLISNGSDRRALQLIRREAGRLGLRILSVDSKRLDQLAEGHQHQGVVAIVEPYRYSACICRFAPRDFNLHEIGMDIDPGWFDGPEKLRCSIANR